MKDSEEVANARRENRCLKAREIVTWSLEGQQLAYIPNGEDKPVNGHHWKTEEWDRWAAKQVEEFSSSSSEVAWFGDNKILSQEKE